MRTESQNHKQCKQAGCDRDAVTAGFCVAHYRRHRTGADMSQPIKTYRKFGRDKGRGPCGVEGCERPGFARGLCGMHYARFKKYGDVMATHRKGPKPNPLRVNLPNETSPTKLARILGVNRQRAHHLLNKRAQLARQAVWYAVRTGRLVKPDACERCGLETLDLEAHHWDYREELDVRWLCPPCHSIVHPHHPTVHGKSNQPTERLIESVREVTKLK